MMKTEGEKKHSYPSGYPNVNVPSNASIEAPVKRAYSTRKPWTDEDIEKLVASYRSIPTSTIAIEMDRPASSIKKKARSLGLRKDARITSHALPIGSERISGGYLLRKISDTGHWLTDWIPVHHLVWAAANGPVPDGLVLTFKDHDRFNSSLGNLELSTPSEVFKRHWLEKYPAELREAIRLQAQLKRKISEHDQ